MLGRVRPSSSSLESLELERPPSKIIKDDSLSIYEATLLKLKEGGQRDLVLSPSVQEVKIDNAGCDFATNSPPDEEAMEASETSDSSPVGSAEVEQKKKKMATSVSYLFAKYQQRAHSALSSPD